MSKCLDAVAQAATRFARTAPGLIAEETLDQKGRRGFGSQDDADWKIEPDFRHHQVTSTYGLARVGEAHALHEIRKIISVDGKILNDPGEARHALTIGLRSADDQLKRKLLEDFEHQRLEGAVTDFGQVILLFTKGRQNDYDFSYSGEGSFRDEDVWFLGYRKVSGSSGMTIFKERTAERQPTEGQIWLRKRDLFPVRIAIISYQAVSKKHTARNEATVDYIETEFGAMVPERVVHRQFIDSDLLVENDFRYSGFRKAE